MVNFTDKQKAALMEQAKSFMEQAQEGKSARDIMAQIYVDGLDNKTLAQGHVMADAILESVNEFDSDYAQAKDDLGRWLDKNLKQLAADMTPQERCMLWLRIAAAVNAVSAQGLSEEEKDRILAQLDELQISEEEATPEMEQQLYEEAKQALEHSSVMLSALVSQKDVFQTLDAEDDAAALLLELGSREIDFRAVASMIAYVNVKNGTFDNIPVDIRLEQITTMVCAEVEQIRILDAVSKGQMTLEVASLLLKILGAICLVKVAFKLGYLVGCLAAALHLGILMLPATILMSLALAYFLNKGFDEWCAWSDKAVSWAAVPIKTAVSAVETVATYVYENVFTQLVAFAAAAWDRLKKLVTGKWNTVVDAEVVAEPLALPEGI